jgi:hypothetical protein
MYSQTKLFQRTLKSFFIALFSARAGVYLSQNQHK